MQTMNKGFTSKHFKEHIKAIAQVVILKNQVSFCINKIVELASHIDQLFYY